MANYTDIPDGNLDPDSPIRSVDGLALRDNPIAIAEGASGAPRVAPEALEARSVGSVRCHYDITVYATDSGGDVSISAGGDDVFSIVVFYPGDYKFLYELKAVNGNTVTAKVKINGSTVNTQTTTSTSFVNKSYSASNLSRGDVITIRLDTSDSNNAGRIGGFEVKTDTFVPIIDNTNAIFPRSKA